MKDVPAKQLASKRAAGALRRFVVWALVGGSLGIIGSLVVLRLARHDPTPALTPELFHEARERWQAAAPENYEVVVRVTGTQPATYRVVVRDGQAEAAWRNGQPLMSRRTFGTWSVPGMFSTISRDVEAIERHAGGQAGAAAPELTLRASFHPRYGYPQTYRRIQWGSPLEVAWEVERFELQ